VVAKKQILAIHNILGGDDPVHGENILVSAVKIYALEVLSTMSYFFCSCNEGWMV